MSSIDLKQFSLTIREQYPHESSYLGDMVQVIECYGGEISVVEHVAETAEHITKDIVIKLDDSTA
jgi:malate dehydrogenase (oxaloacetate-decarboxylating)